MAHSSPRMAAITCPNCGQHFSTPTHSIVDVGQDPGVKDRLLRGQINVAICPQCGVGGTLSVPFLYHDPQKELLFVYTPPTVLMDSNQQQRFIGSLINRVMTSLPQERRKGYLFQPRTFLSMETMLDEIIMADGLSRQELESQKRKLQLLDRLVNASSDDVIEIIARENEKDLDYEFFLVLNNLVERMRTEGNEAEAARLQELHHKLLRYSEAARQGDVESEQIISKDELLQRLLKTDDEGQQKSLAAAARPLLDYGFFQALTAIIEEAQQTGDIEKANQHLDLRSKLLQWIKELDDEARKLLERKVKLIQEVLQSSDWRAALEPQWHEIDRVFLIILDSNIQQAQQQGDTQTAATLQQLADLALVVARDHAPPEVQLLNQLLDADYPEGTQRILEQNRAQLGAGFLKLIDAVIQDLAAQGRQQDVNTVQLIRAQIKAMSSE